ncbi:site-specific integrase [[Clostridium] innocuum]|nr:site-specific integrase [[Clostridium] innocuum]
MAKKRTERLPRGFGGVIFMKGNRAKPYMARVRVGTIVNKEKGTAYPDYKIIGYAETRLEGIELLQKYHENPYDYNNHYTFEDIFKKAFDEFIADKSPSSIQAYKSAFKVCKDLHNIEFKEIRTIQLQRIIDTCGKNYPTLKKIKVLFNVMYKYAMKYDLCPKDNSKYVDILKFRKQNPNARDRDPFGKKDIDLLWTMKNDKWFQIPLMLIYTGVRISELLELEKVNVNLEEQWFDVVKSKTDSGVRRVPIANCILPFFKEWYEYSEAETLICMPSMQPFKYRNYYDAYWTPTLEPVGLSKFTPHCTRHTCISLLAEAKVDQTSIKLIVGHRGAMSLTEKVYTHLDINTLIDAVNKIYIPDSIKQQKKIRNQ